MRYLLLLLLLIGCSRQETLELHTRDRNRFLSENRHAARIIQIDDGDFTRKVKVQGIITGEVTWAVFTKNQSPKVGEISRLSIRTNGETAWFRLSMLPASLED